MANVTIAGVTYGLPAPNDQDWDQRLNEILSALAAASPAQDNSGSGQNFAPNSQWQLLTAVGGGPKLKSDGSAEMGTYAVSGYSTGSNTVTANCANTAGLKLGDLMVFLAPAHANLLVAPVRINAIVNNVSFSFGLPLGLTGQGSVACTAIPYDAGGAASASTGDAFDGWTKTVGTWVWREDNLENIQLGSTYVAGVKKQLVTRENLYCQVPAKDLAKYRGRTVVFGGGVYHRIKTSAGTWRPFINAGGTEIFGLSATSQGYTWGEVKAVIPASATIVCFGWAFDGALGDTYYCTHPTFRFGDAIGAWNYYQPQGEYISLKVHANPASHIGASISFPATPSAASDNTAASGGGVGNDFGFKVRVTPETGGKIAPTCREIKLQLEAKPNAVTLNRSNALKQLLLDCVTGGTRGTASFRISSDGGATWSSTLVSASGSGTIQWVSGTYSGDANNNTVKYQIINVGNGGSYVSGNRWTIPTDITVGASLRTTGSGYDGISITPVTQEVVLALRNQEPDPQVYGVLLTAHVLGTKESQSAFCLTDPNGDLFMYTGTMNAGWTLESIDINGVLIS